MPRAPIFKSWLTALVFAWAVSACVSAPSVTRFNDDAKPAAPNTFRG